jgi:hypothetical protein
MDCTSIIQSYGEREDDTPKYSQIYYKSMTDNTSSNSDSKINVDSLFKVFTDSNVVIIIWFLVVYFVVYLLLNIFRGKDGVRNSLSRWVDIVSLLLALTYLVFTYFGKSDEEKKEIIADLYSNFKTYLNSPLSIISAAFFIFTLYIVIYILEIPMDSFGKPITISIIENVAWILLVLVLLATFLKYVAGVSMTDFMDEIKQYLQDKAQQVEGNTKAESSSISENVKYGSGSGSSANVPVVFNEVFNVKKNMFTYDDAKTVCASYGARLATYDELESAYNNGAEWCNYGWSEGQSIYFPTQKSTWQELQKSESTKHSCGRPGINGGYIENDKARFGVNCFGKKPKPSSAELEEISSGKVVPKTPEDELLKRKIEFWNANRDKLLKVNGYNNNKWSAY